MGDQQELECGRDHPLAVQEWLASCVLEHIANPRVVCRLALVNRNFCAASVSDTVWQKLLPPPDILNPFLAHANHHPLSKKHLFLDLCKSITYDHGLKKFWLDPTTGGECHMMSARALSIEWGNTPQYWQWKPYYGSMFSEVACLIKVCLFEVKGTFQNVFRPGRYMVSFRLQIHSTDHWADHWDRVLVNLCVQNVTCAHPPQESRLHFDIRSFKIRPCPSSNMFVTSSEHIWVECDAGEFIVEDDNENRPIEVKFSMTEMGWWKTGLFLDGVIIRPSYVIDNFDNERNKALSP